MRPGPGRPGRGVVTGPGQATVPVRVPLRRLCECSRSRPAGRGRLTDTAAWTVSAAVDPLGHRPEVGVCEQPGGLAGSLAGEQGSRGTPRIFPASRRPARPWLPRMTGHPCGESPARPGGPRRPARTGGSGQTGRRGRASQWTRIRRLEPGCPRASQVLGPGTDRVPGTDQPYNVDHREDQQPDRDDEQKPEAGIGHQACLSSAGEGPYTGESVARRVLVTGG